MYYGFDIGGTKIALGVFDNQRRLQWEKRVPTPRDSYDAFLDAVCDLVTEADQRFGVKGSVGIGIPGMPETEDGTLYAANVPAASGKPLRTDLSARLDRDVRLDNDANCFALSEAWDDEFTQYPLVMGLILGTGVGGGIVIDGQLLSGPNRIAGEWGHNPLAPDPAGMPGAAPACYCGRCGCVEAWLSGPALAADHARQTGECLSAAAIAVRAAAGDEAAQSALERHALRLAQALAGVINVLDPEVIVLGGGLSRLPGLAGRVSAAWGSFVFTDEPVRTRLLLPRFGDDSGVRGAAWLALGMAGQEG